MPAPARRRREGSRSIPQARAARPFSSRQPSPQAGEGGIAPAGATVAGAPGMALPSKQRLPAAGASKAGGPGGMKHPLPRAGGERAASSFRRPKIARPVFSIARSPGKRERGPSRPLAPPLRASRLDLSAKAAAPPADASRAGGPEGGNARSRPQAAMRALFPFRRPRRPGPFPLPSPPPQAGEGAVAGLAPQSLERWMASSAKAMASGVPTCIQMPSSRRPNSRSAAMALSKMRLREKAPSGVPANSSGFRIAAPA